MLIRSKHQIELPGGGGLLKVGDNPNLVLALWQRRFLEDLCKAGFCEIFEDDPSQATAPAAEASSPDVESAEPSSPSADAPGQPAIAPSPLHGTQPAAKRSRQRRVRRPAAGTA